jgi:hypothetical protein
MAEQVDWTARSHGSRPSQHSIHSVGRNLTSSPTANDQKQIASDSVSAIPQHLVEDVSGYTGQQVPGPTATQGYQQVMSTPEPFSPPMTSPAAWSDGGDLGSRSPHAAPAPNAEYMNINAAANYPAAQQWQTNQAPFGYQDSPMAASNSQFLFSPDGHFNGSRGDLSNSSGVAKDWTDTPTPPPYVAPPPPVKAWWRWRPAWIMYVFFLVGFLCAMGHHIFFAYLDGRAAENQIWILRYSAAFAFATKAALVSAVIVAYRQRIWTTVRQKMLSVSAIDSLFAAAEDFYALWNIEVYKRAKIAIALALLVWVAPLVIILTSNTLTVELGFYTEQHMCQGVRTLNFAKEGEEHWRTPTRIDNLFGWSVSTWNKTAMETSPAWFDYYTSYSQPWEQVATVAAYRKQTISQTNVAMDICGPGWNCTYSVKFVAPGYRCEEVASGVGSSVRNLRDHRPPSGFDTDILLPTGNLSYHAFTTGGDYSTSQMAEIEPGGLIAGDIPETLGAFRTEPLLWIGYSQRVNPGENVTRGEPGWDEAFIPKVFACEHYETEYEVRFNHTGGQQFTNVTTRDFLRPVISTNWLQDNDANDGTNDNTTAYPPSNYVYPTPDDARYRNVAAYHSTGKMLRYFLNGTIQHATVDGPISNTKAAQTKVIDTKADYWPVTNLMDSVQDLYENMLFSIFSEQQFLSVVWAAKPDESSGVLRGDDSTLYPCERTRFENRYRYHRGTLWAVYGVAILVSILAIISGTLAVFENEGVLRDTKFSDIVAATRGPALEKLAADENKGELNRNLKSVRVGYGIVQSPPANGLGVSPAGNMVPLQEGLSSPEQGYGGPADLRYGFGLEGDVMQMRNDGKTYRASRAL